MDSLTSGRWRTKLSPDGATGCKLGTNEEAAYP